ncbi:MAG: DUF1499 domain-containing protein [Prochloraceae cyanobacterium]|nr:DUF1499 domain-containing protein [Prochloraceae cyanobacterium]
MTDVENKPSIIERLRLPVRILFVLGIVVWIGFRIVFPESPTFFSSTQPTNLGVNAGKLAVCSTKPNCVNSQTTAEDTDHSIDPLKYDFSSPTEAIANLDRILKDLPRVDIISETDNYLYAQVTSRWMGFVDDLEFYVNKDAGIIEVRSSARLGESDLGVNRQRIENIRTQLNQLYSSRNELSDT